MEIITNKLFDFDKRKNKSKMPSTTNLTEITTTPPTPTPTPSTSEQIKNFLSNMNKSLNNSLNSITSSLKSTTSSKRTLSPSNQSENNDTSVRVALRIRPQLARERIEMCKICTYVTPNEPQVTLGHDKSFTFDYVFDTISKQEDLFNSCVKTLIDGCLNGYNATVLAYGQTGSGKTYTMGTSFDINLLPEDDGIIPRAVGYLFKRINDKMTTNDNSKPTFEVIAQFMELYNEDIIDLFDINKNNAISTLTSSSSVIINNNNSNNLKNKIEIHEDNNGNVFVNGCTMRKVDSAYDTLELLKTGARIRTTASTNMNLTSSRSHAIFTLHIKQQRIIRESINNDINQTQVENDIETLSAKFHFVDLAGSERLKRTGAIGERAKEGICINRGLLALGNVISALGDIEKKGCHVPYRDSKLTRLLQDSLGGNSRTLMIACVSSSDSDFMETLNTLRYANRARNIKNKIIINQDKTSKQIALLRAEIQKLQLELMEYKSGKKLIATQQILNNSSNKINDLVDSNITTGASTITSSSSTTTGTTTGTTGTQQISNTNNLLIYYDGNKISVDDLKQENYLIKNENNSLKIRCKALQETIDNLRDKNIKLQTNLDIYKLNNNKNNNNEENTDTNLIENYIKQIEELRCKLIESESICKQLRNKQTRVNTIQTTSKTTTIKTPLISSSSSDLQVKKYVKRFLENYDDGEKHEINNQKQDSFEKLLDEAKKDKKELEKKKLELVNKSLNIDEILLKTSPTSSITTSNDLTESTNKSLIESFNEKTESNINQNEIEIQENLTNLNVEIDLKERLICELEEQKNQFNLMKYYYEEKLDLLNERMHKIESERDNIIDNYSKLNQSFGNDEKIKKIKIDYELKLKNLSQEIQKYTNLKQKHQQMLKQQHDNEKQIEQMNKELVEMKKFKIKLLKQLKNETSKYKLDEKNYLKEIQSLKRDHAKKDSQIRNLNEENKRKCIILKRKQEQLQALSKQQRQVLMNKSNRMSGGGSNVCIPSASNGNNSYSQKINQFKWQNIENNIQAIITKKQTICLIERDMERYLEQREKIGRKLDRLQNRYEKVLNQVDDQQKADDLKDQIDIMKSNIDYIQDQITECQTNIIELDESKDAKEMLTAQNLITSINSIDEAKYLVEKFYNLALNKGVIAAQKEYLNKELEIELTQFERDHYVQQQILQQLMASDSMESANNNDYEIDEIILAPHIQESSDSDSSSRSLSPVRPLSKLLSGTRVLCVSGEDDKNINNDSITSSDAIKMQRSTNEKIRSKVPVGPDELLYASLPTPSHMQFIEKQQQQQLPQQQQSNQNGNLVNFKRSLSQSYTKLAPASKNIPIIDDYECSQQIQETAVNHRARPRTKSISRQNSKDSILSTSPNGSPNTFSYKRGLRDENVFNRLTSETKQSPLPEMGSIKPYSGSTTRFIRSPIICSHTAEGHSKAVLSVDSYDYRLFTGSKDRTAKIWDLHTGQEILSLCGHPNNVTKIRYCPHTNLVFTVSSSYVKVWDIREAPSTCIKTLSSSGLVIDGDLGIYKSNRTLLNELPSGEHQINDIVLERYGNRLYTAAGNSVKIWDLRQFLTIGRLSAGHNSTIMTLALDDVDYDNNVLITGSKDHYIKIFDANNGIGVIPAKRSLTPPHYDGIQTLAIIGDTLFSGSRDMCIKKWDLVDYQCKQSLNNAHKDWICALDYLSDLNMLISGCRAGYLKFWNIETCEKQTEFRAHICPINSIKVENNFVYTASDDATIRIWKRNFNN